MRDLLFIAVKASIEAGIAILDIYNDPKSDFNIEKKEDNSPLTIADKVSNKIIIDYLKPLNYPILSEEEKNIDYSIRKGFDTLWIIDPLDGTKEFIKKNGEFTVNIALVEKGIPVVGVIYVPVKNILYFSAKNIGSYKIENFEIKDFSNLEKLINQSDKLPKDNKDNIYRIVASRSHCNEETLEFINKLKIEHGDVELTNSGSSLKICLVAEGSANIYPRFAPTMEWDTAAGHAIALYANKNIYNIDNKTQIVYNKENLLNPWFIVR